MKRFVRAVAVCAVLCSLHGCGRKEGGGVAGKITLSFWKAPHGDDARIWKPILEAFEKENPNIHVEHLVISWDAWDEKYRSAFASGKPPDVSYMPDEHYPGFAAERQLVALDEQFGPQAEKLRPLFYENLWNTGKLYGHLWGIPYLTANTAFYWNREAFKRAGLDPGKPPGNWDELRAYARKLTIKDASGKVTQYGYAIPSWPFSKIFDWYIFLETGAHPLSDDRKHINFSTPESLRAFKYFQDFYQTDQTAPPVATFPGEQFREAFASGKVAMENTTSDVVPIIQKINPKLDFGVAENPKGPANNNLYGGVGFWCIAKDSPHPKEAWKLIEFLSRKESHEKYIKAVNLLSSRKDVKLYSNNRTLGLSEKLVSQTVSLPLGAHTLQWLKLLDSEVEAVELGQKTPEQAAKDAEKVINPILDGK